MKKVIFESQSPSRKEIWVLFYHNQVHPECATWCYPLIWMKTKQRCMFLKETPQTPTGKFWVRVEDEPNKKCLLCADNYGYKIKVRINWIQCTFYSCQKFYHITCAKKIGVIRDLESMRYSLTEVGSNPTRMRTAPLTVPFTVRSISKRMCWTLAIESRFIARKKSMKKWPILPSCTTATKVSFELIKFSWRTWPHLPKGQSKKKKSGTSLGNSSWSVVSRSPRWVCQ